MKNQLYFTLNRVISNLKNASTVSVLMMALFLGNQQSFAQPWSYDFGTGTGAYNTASGINTSFFTFTPSGGGTYRIRCATAPGTGFNLVNPGTTLGTGTELQINASTSTSTNKFTVSGWNIPTHVAYMKCNFRTTSTGNGNFAFQLGDGTTGGDALGYTQEYGSSVASLAITYASGAISVINRRTGGTNTAVSGSGIAKDADQSIEIYVNNYITSVTYVKSGTNTLNAGCWDLWIDGTKISSSGGWVTAGLTTGTAISSIGFYAESSTSNAGIFYIDDLEYSNTLPSIAYSGDESVFNFDSRASSNWGTNSTWIKKLTGSVTFAVSTAVVGTNTAFTRELTNGDVLMLQASTGTVRGTVASITDDTHLTLIANSTAGNGTYGKQASPTSANGVITILGSHTVTVAADVTADQVSCVSGSGLTIANGSTLTIANGTGADLFETNATVNVNGALVVNSNATCGGGGGNGSTNGAINVNSGGIVTLNGTIDGQGQAVGIITNVASGGLINVNNAGTLSSNRGNVGTNIFISGTVHVANGGTISVPGTGTNLAVNSGGVLEMESNTAVTGSTFTLGTGGTLRIASTAGITSSGSTGNVQTTTRNYGTDANYNYNGTAAQVTGNGLPTTLTGNLTITNTVGVTPTNNYIINTPGSLIIDGLFTPGASQVMSGTGTVTGTGTAQVSRTAATADFSSQYNITTKTVGNLTAEYIAGSAQTVSALTYGGLKINNTAGVTLAAGGATVNNTLTFTSSPGKITTGANTLSLASGATVTGAAAGKYVFGNLLWNIPTGSGVSRIFDIGDATNYTPVTVDFASVSVAGTLTGSSTSGDHPNIGTSSFNASQSINRYWSLTKSAPLDFSTYDATFNYIGGTPVDKDAGVNSLTVFAGKYNSPTWTYPVMGTRTATSAQVTGVNSFSDFQLGGCVAPTLSATGTDPSCNGANDGTITLTVTGGGPDPTFSWSPGGSTDQNPTGLSAGSYTVIVTANGGCSATLASPVVLTNPAVPTASITGSGVTACPGDPVTFNIDFTGTPQFTYSYNEGATPFGPFTTSSDPEAVVVTPPSLPMTYTLTSMSDNGCPGTVSGSFTVTEQAYTITASAGPNGSITPPGVTTLSCDGSQSYTITPAACYSVANVIVDGVSQGAITSYDFTNVAANHTISATFVVNTLTITATSDANGTITPPGVTTVSCGGSQSYTIAANAGYNIVEVYVDGVPQGPITSYTFTNVTADHTISLITGVNSYVITATAGAGGSISPSGSVSVAAGANQTFTITADPCYHIADILVDGNSVGTSSPYTFTSVSANHTIDATFELNDYTITATAGTNGSISPGGAVSVTCGDDQDFDITADPCYHILAILVDGSPVSFTPGSSYTYTFTNVTANHTIHATFAINGPYTITATAGPNGSISPSGAVSVTCGADQVFTITPLAPCYHIADVEVDGNSVGAVASYTFENVTANHTIHATFAINGPFTITASSGTGGSVIPSGITTVACSESQEYNIVPDDCYSIADVLVDNVSVGALAVYTFSNVITDHTISATFIFNGPYTITASAGANGSISPSGAVSVICGDDQAFTITPDACFEIADVLADNVSVGAVASYTFSDVHANHTISATFVDDTPPSAFCQSISVSLDGSGNASITASQVNSGSSDACGIASMSVFPSSFTCANKGPNTVTLTVNDANGNSATCQATVTVIDDLPPVLSSCPGDGTFDCSSVPAAPVITATDNCPGVSSVSFNETQTNPGACNNVITRTWSATDASANPVSCTQIITVTPAALPVISNPGDITVACGSVPALSTQTFTNSLSAPCLISGTSNTSTQTAQSPAGACGGTITETWTATDECGRALAPVSRTITVSPAALPVISNPGDITVACGSVPALSTQTFTNSLSGGCLISGTSNTSTQTAQSPAGACGGTITETWTATDECGRALAPVSRTITVSPAALPVISNPGDITVACGAVPALSTQTFTNSLSGGCLISGTSNTSTQTAQSPAGACGGTITETWTATDECGRLLASVSRTITVSPAALPVISNPGDITVACGSVPALSTQSFTNSLSGGCLISGTSNTSTQTAQSPAGACGGTITETWTATDECGRPLASVSRTITVSPAALPVISNPGDITVACGSVPALSTQTFTNSLSGGCLISGTSNTSTQTAQSPAGACGGTITETWTATDICGRPLASVSRTITVSPAALPVISNPGDITVACGAVPALSTQTFTNSLSGGCLISGTSNTSTQTAQSPAGACGGTITETWTATDECGRPLASVSRTITVSPAALPVISNPGNITVACGSVPALSTQTFTNSLSGGCLISGTSNTSTQTAQSPAGACGGTITETWTATDECGRPLASVSRTITVSPAALPTMTAPAAITVACGGVPAPSTISFTNGLSGGCLISGTSDASTFTTTPGPCGGTVTETWTATDECGRPLASVSRTITVSPAALPTMTAPAAITVACGGVPAPSTISFTNGLSGGCLISGTSDASTFTTTPGPCGGTVTETWTATDECGRPLASVSRTITVSPAALPTMTAPAAITVACGGVPAPSTISFTNGLSGGCLISGTSDASTFTTTPGPCGGTVTETWTATDECGRPLASVSRTITVSPAALPTMTAPAAITVACGGVPAPSTISFTNGLSGGCLISGTSDPSTFSATPGPCGGTVTETWTATDECGRPLASVSRTITVSPAALPTMTAPAAITVACGGVPAPSTISFTNGLSGGCLISGTSDASTFTTTPGPCGGTVTETWTATDECGRPLASVSRTITVSPAALPTMTAPAAITVACGGVPAPSTLSFSNGLSGGCLISGTSDPSTFSATPGPCGGTVTETWTATDECGRPLASVSRTITVSPAALPTMTAPAAITVACGGVPAPSTISFTNGLSGGCLISGTSDLSTFSATPGPCGGTVTETWTATDECGRPLASVSRTITVSPAALPTMTAPAAITVACGAVPAPSTISFTNGLSGGCLISGTSDLSTFSATPGPCGGTVTETWTATDECGRPLASVSRTITVSPAALPTMTAPAAITVACGAVPAPSTISFTNGLSGGCLISGTSDPSTFSATPGPCGGTVTETWTATDECGRPLASVSRIITVSPAALPTMTAPAAITVACGGVPAPSTISFTNGLSGGCLISGTSDPSTFSATPGPCGGTVTETWTATDICGRPLASVSRTITVSPAALPTMTAPAPITVACGGVPAPSTLSFTNGLSGGCLISGTSDPSTFSAAPGPCGGTVTETWTATDECGRPLASVSRIITVSPAALPTMTAPAAITVACGGVPAPSTISFTNGLSGGCLISGTSDLSTFSATPGPCGGTVTETWTATDECGRPLASVSRTITVSPAALPTMTAPAAITVACGGVPAPSTLSFTNGLSGGCLISGTSDLSTFSATPGPCGGTVTETWTATDICGRPLASVSRTITVSPAALPTMTAPAAITVACGGVPAPSTISFTNGLSGGCLISGTSDPSTFSATPGPCGGTVTETWTATDECGRPLASVSRTITVSPAALPTMTAPAAITVACGGVPAPSTISFTNGLSGGCLISGTSDLSTFSATPGPCGGTVTETWTATDECGRPLASVSRTITVSPAALPTMTAPAAITVACGGVPAPSTLSFTNGLSGGCLISGTSNSSTFTATPGPCGGTVTETWTATDVCGRPLASVSRTITVSPAALPTMTAPAAITVACGGVPAPSTISFTNGLSGGCLISGTSDASTFTTTPGPCGGTVTETWTATDACGRALASVSRTITVSPAALPVISNPGDITVACGLVPALSTRPFTNSLSGGCLISGTSNTSTQTAQSPAGACGGTITETWTATDECGRALAPVSRTITVSPAALPVISNPGDITVACGAVPALSTRPFTNSLSGGCLISGTSNTSTQTAQSPAGACGGTITETWTATDECGRPLASVSRTITVSPAALPTMTAPAAITVACGGVPAPSTISFTNGLSGGCLISGTSNASTFSATPGPCGGTVTETWTATDNCGRPLASVSRTITVSPAALPTMTAPPNITVPFSSLPAPGTLPYSNGLSGGCLISGNSNISTYSPTPTACVGTVTQTWTATDPCGRPLAPVSRTITILDDVPPTAVCQNISVNLNGSGNASITAAQINNGSFDNCGTLNLVSVSPSAFTCANLGANTVTLTVNDGNGNTSTCVATVNVNDNTLPTITCPPTVTVNTDAGVCYATNINFGTPVYGDNCGGAVITNNVTPSTQFPLGGTFIQWEVTDLSSNKTSCDQLVIVVDNNPPVALCKNICVSLNAAGVATITAADINNGSYDNCALDPGPNGLVVSPSSFTYANAGANTVTLTVKDLNGNTSTCTATVTVGEFYTLFGSDNNCTTAPGGPAGCYVNISNGSTVNGNVGSYRLVQTGGAVTINGKVVSGGKVSYANGVTSGSVSAANILGVPGNIFTTGSAAHILGDIDVVGNINVNQNGGSTVSGTVRHPVGTTYTGPVPGGGVLTAAPILPALPGMPTTHTYTCGGANISGSAVLNPGSYGNLVMGNAAGVVVTFHGPGNYYFSNINMSQGGIHTFKYDFMNQPGNINIYVCSTIHLGQIATLWAGPNTPDACRVYFEVQGNGINIIGLGSQFYGRMWAPNSGINVGGGSCCTYITGSLWSAQKIDFNGNVTVNKCGSPCALPRIEPGLSSTDNMKEMIQVYPNPTSGKATLSFFTEIPYDYTLKVFDNLGRMVISKASKAAAGDNLQEIDMSGWPKGLYLVEVANADHSQKVKLLVQ